MMALNPSTAPQNGPDLSSPENQPSQNGSSSNRMKSRISKFNANSGGGNRNNKIIRNRRRSIGTIAGYVDSPAFANESTAGLSSDSNISKHALTSAMSRNSVGNRHGNTDYNLSSGHAKNQQLENLKNIAIQNASQSCHAARLSLVCINNLNFGNNLVRLSLCPKKMRKRIFQNIIEEKSKSKRQHSITQNMMLEEQQSHINSIDEFEREDESSGDEEDEEDNDQHVDDPPAVSGKLAFGRRKIAFFDMVTAQDRERARIWLKKETLLGKKRDREILVSYLKNIQQMQAQALKNDVDCRMESGSPTTEDDFMLMLSTRGEKKRMLLNKKYPETTLPSDTSLTLNAAFILESLSFTQLESLEGMNKCYDDLVAAGTALLEDDEKSRSNSNAKSSNSNVKKNSRNKILTALATILITTLEFTSGEAILALARLRSMCGTSRYKYRFTERIAPLLIRPPNSAIWCLRQQKDIRAIVTVTELLFDAADDIFSHGWYDRGRSLLADGRRAESLNAAAIQLRALSNNALSISTHRTANSLLQSIPKTAEDASTKHFAESEILEVDVQIRKSINNLFTKDWTNFKPTPRPQTSNTVAPDASVLKIREIRSSGSPRQSQVPLSPLSIGEALPSVQTNIPSTRNHHPQQEPSSPSKSPQTQQIHRQQTKLQNQQSRPYKQQQPPKLSPPDGIKIFRTETTPNTPITPPRSPGSPNSKKSTASLTNRDHLLSTAPQMPTMSMNSNASNTKLAHTEFRTPNPPAPPLSPTLSNASSHHSQRTHHSAQMNTTFGSSHRPSAAERKRIVAACRALRAQIARFEESFIALHGRHPKGAAERAPLATTYAQYREWKKAIRADAATRIQALYRGARLRIYVLHQSKSSTGDDRYSKWKAIILKTRKKNKTSNYPPHLSIPVEIDDIVVPEGNSPSGLGNDDGRGDGVEVVISPTSLYKRPGNLQTQNKGSGRGKNVAEKSLNKSHQQNQYSGNKGAVADASVSPDLKGRNPTMPRRGDVGQHLPITIDTMSLQELIAEKRNLKNRLKQYDMDFFRMNQRMPVKSEKEPIRFLYETYNALKSRIQSLINGDNNNSTSMSTSMQKTAQLDRGGSRYSRSNSVSSYSIGTESSSDENLSDMSSASSSRQHTRRDKISSNTAFSTNSSSNTLSGPSTSNTLESLRAEKTRLHQMLRSYEREFYRDNQRQVSSFTDIRPVASQYRRYKEIKKSIAALQEENASAGGNGR